MLSLSGEAGLSSLREKEAALQSGHLPGGKVPTKDVWTADALINTNRGCTHANIGIVWLSPRWLQSAYQKRRWLSRVSLAGDSVYMCWRHQPIGGLIDLVLIYRWWRSNRLHTVDDDESIGADSSTVFLRLLRWISNFLFTFIGDSVTHYCRAWNN